LILFAEVVLLPKTLNKKELNSRRKEEHLRINLQHDVQFEEMTAGFEDYRFIHQALPEVDAAAIDLSIDLFGKRLNTPIIISSMVGGIGEAQPINRNLAGGRLYRHWFSQGFLLTI